MTSLLNDVHPARLGFDYYGYLVPIKVTLAEKKYSKKEWGPWKEIYDVQLESYEIKKIDEIPDEDCFEVVSELDLPPGSEAWIVWVVWSSGDSFGWAKNKHVEVLAIFDHEWYANVFADYVRSEDYESNNLFMGGTDKLFDFQSEDGQVFKYDYIPWDGYFESLEAVHVDRVKVV